MKDYSDFATGFTPFNFDANFKL